MKRSAFLALVLSLMLVAVSFDRQFEPVAQAEPAAHGGRGGGGHEGGGHGGFHGHPEGFRGGGHFEGGIWFGPGWGFGDPLYYPFYPYYPYYAPPAVVSPQQPEEYILPVPQKEDEGYWYYCKERNGYYPYVNRCPSGWLQVVPTPPPPDQDEED